VFSINPKYGEKTARFVTSHPWWSLVAGMLVVMAACMGLGQLKANFTHTAFLEKDDQILKTFEAFERKFGNDDSIAVIVGSPSGVFDEETAALLRSMTAEMWKVPEVIRVESLANFQWVHATGDELEVESLLPDEGPLTPAVLKERKAVALAHELLPGFLVAKDGKAALIYARVRPGVTDRPNTRAVVEGTRALVAKFQGGDHSFHITGPVAIEYAFQESSQKDTSTLVPLMLLMTVLILAATFRSVGGVLLPMLAVLLSVMAALGCAGWFGIEVSSVTIVLPQALLAIGIADSVHVLTSFYGGRREGLGKREAAFAALSSNFTATLFTNVTTAAGFFSFFSAKLKPISGLGIAAGCGTMLAWATCYFVLGPLLVLLPSWVKQRPQSVKQERGTKALRYTQFLWRHRMAVLVGSIALTVSGGVLAASNSINSDPFKYFAKDDPLRVAQDFVLEHLGGIPGYELVLYADGEGGARDPGFLRKVEEFEKRATALPKMSHALSVVDILRQTNRALHGGDQAFYKLPEGRDSIAQELFLYTMSLPQGMDLNDRITTKNDAVRLTLLCTISDSKTWMETADVLRREAEALGLRAELTGKSALYQSMNGYVVQSFVESMLWSLLSISAMLAVAFGSLRAGLMSLPTNIVPLFLGGGALTLMNTPLDMGTVLVGSVCFGIVVDDTIHLVTAFNRAIAKGKDAPGAVAVALQHAGVSCFVTTLVLVGGFAMLALGSFMPNVYFGLLTAIVLLAGLVIDLTLLPVLLMMFGAREQLPSQAREGALVQHPAE